MRTGTYLPGRRSVAAGLGATLLAGIGTAPRRARAVEMPIRIGVINDQSGPYAATGGPGSVAAARIAVQELGGSVLARPIEILVGDHQNKPDIGVAIARRWLDAEGVQAIADGGSSAVGLAVQDLTRARKRIFLITGSSSSEFTNAQCSPTGFHWMTDTYSTAASTVQAELKRGNKSFFFLTADYTFGYELEKAATANIVAGGGRVAGRARFPLGSADFSSLLLQAQSSGAQVIALNASGADAVNAVKQAQEFGIMKGQVFTDTSMVISDLEGMGLDAAHGLTWSTTFYWDRDDASRAWTKRFMQLHKQTPTRLHAGTYSAVLHYLTAIAAAGSDDGAAVAARMRATPLADSLFAGASIRADGRVMLDQYLMLTKSPGESHGPMDYATVVATIPAAQAYRPTTEETCPLLGGR